MTTTRKKNATKKNAAKPTLSERALLWKSIRANRKEIKLLCLKLKNSKQALESVLDEELSAIERPTLLELQPPTPTKKRARK